MQHRICEVMDEELGKVRSRGVWWVYLLGVLIFLSYALWMVGPYLRSTVVRDAAVTAWANTATSPIDGTVDFLPLRVGGLVGDDGVVAHIRNEHLSQKSLSEAQVEVGYIRAQVSELENFLDEIKYLDAERADLKSQYADVFREQLDTQIENLGRELEVTSRQLDIVTKIAARKVKLAEQGVSPRNSADEALLKVAELELKVARLRTRLSNAEMRTEPAREGVFISQLGDDPDWVRGSRTELKVHKKQARLELRRAEAELRLAEARLTDLKTDFERQSKAAVLVPAKSVIWSQNVALGSAVELGSPILEWLDCSVLMIDVPVSDVEASLIKNGMRAEVILEGEDNVREADVLLTRGSAATLGRTDLAALAKGRRGDAAQVVLDFAKHASSFATCPVGRAAYVNFPSIGLIDVVRARLRL